MNIPEKHPDVADVSDDLWEAAIALACDRQCYIFESITNWESQDVIGIIDHARCLILLGEVKEPVNPIDAAMEAAVRDFNLGGVSFRAVCRKHFAGLTFPEVKS